MKKLTIFIAVLSLLFVFCLCSCAGTPTEGLKYNLLSDGTYEVSIGSATDVSKIVIPKTVSEKPVTKIAEFGFAGATNIESVSLPKTITIISESAFEGCTGLKKINIPSSVSTVGIFAFSSCESLEKITLPEEIKELGDGAFCGCIGLKTISIPSMKIESLGENLLAECTSVESITVPFVGGTIKDDKGLSHIFAGTAPDTLKSVKVLGGAIKAGAFKNLGSIEKIEITEDVAQAGVDKNAFKGCVSLVYNEYKGCLYLGSKKNKYIALIEAESTDIESCKISRKAKIICQGAFESCEKIEEIKLGKNVERVETGAFRDCKNLQSIYIPKGVKVIEEDAFIGCIRLTIRCEAEKMPKEEGYAWSSDWNPLNRPVVWGE